MRPFKSDNDNIEKQKKSLYNPKRGDIELLRKTIKKVIDDKIKNIKNNLFFNVWNFIKIYPNLLYKNSDDSSSSHEDW